MNRKYQNIGLANRAGKIVCGEFVIPAIQKKQAYLVLMDESIGQNMRKKLFDKCKTYEIPYLICSSELFQIVFPNKNYKSCAICDVMFAKKLRRI